MAFMNHNIRQRICSSNTSALLPRKYTPAYDCGMETTYSVWLRKLMAESGITQYKLSSLSGVPQPTIQRILSGESKNPKADTLGKLSRVLQPNTSNSPALNIDLNFTEGPYIPGQEGAASNVPPEFSALLSKASPRSYKQLMSIAEAAADGRLSEADINLINQIAERIQSKE